MGKHRHEPEQQDAITEVSIMTDAGEFTFFATDLAHLDLAISSLRKTRKHTAADRVGYVRRFLAGHFAEVDMSEFEAVWLGGDPAPPIRG
jgi:hypothetical protein